MPDDVPREFGNCGFFETTDSRHWNGRCRFNPPGLHGWPAVTQNEWCGRFEPKDIPEGLDG